MEIDENDDEGYLLDAWVCKLCHRRCVNVKKCECGLDPLPRANTYFGYNVESFKRKDQECLESFGLTCSICRGVFSQPVRFVKCEHTFCSGCVVRFLGSTGDNFACPLCKSCALFKPAYFVRRMLDKLSIKCEFSGCTYQCSLDRIHKHVEVCTKNPHMKCSDCHMVFQKENRRAHFKTHCRVRCKWCKKSFLRSVMPMHVRKCSKNPITNCQYCGLGIKKKNLIKHMQDECSLRNFKITCPEKLCGKKLFPFELEKHKKTHPYGVKGQIFCKCPFNSTLTMFWHPKQTVELTLDLLSARLGIDRNHLTLFRNVKKIIPGTFEDNGIENLATLQCRYSK